jgi:hypothetical protein
MGTFNVRDNGKSEEEQDRAIDHLRDFLNVNHVPATEVARSLNVRPEWVLFLAFREEPAVASGAKYGVPGRFTK